MNDTPPTATPPAPGILARLRLLAIKIGLLIVLLLAFIYVVPRLLPTSAIEPHAPQNPADITAMASRLQALEERVKKLGAAPMPPPPLPMDAGPSPTVSEDGRLAQIEQRLSDLQRQVENSNGRATATTLFYQMKEAITRGEPFREPWMRLGLLMQNNKEAQAVLEKLAPFADKGAPTPASLKADFEATIPKALAPSATAGSLTTTLQSLIRIRKIGEAQQGADDESVIARAEAKLDRGEIEPALKEMAQLSPPAADSFSAWTKQAESYLGMREAVAALQATLAQELQTP